MLKWPPKDPAERLDYQVDWSNILGADSPDGEPVVTATGGLVAEAPTTVDKITTIWISGGSAAEASRLDAHVCFLLTTVGGRKISLKVGLPIGTGC